MESPAIAGLISFSSAGVCFPLIICVVFLLSFSDFAAGERVVSAPVVVAVVSDSRKRFNSASTAPSLRLKNREIGACTTARFAPRRARSSAPCPLALYHRALEQKWLEPKWLRTNIVDQASLGVSESIEACIGHPLIRKRFFFKRFDLLRCFLKVYTTSYHEHKKCRANTVGGVRKCGAAPPCWIFRKPSFLMFA